MKRKIHFEEKIIMEINKMYNENCLDTMARMPDIIKLSKERDMPILTIEDIKEYLTKDS